MEGKESYYSTVAIEDYGPRFLHLPLANISRVFEMLEVPYQRAKVRHELVAIAHVFECTVMVTTVNRHDVTPVQLSALIKIIATY